MKNNMISRFYQRRPILATWMVLLIIHIAFVGFDTYYSDYPPGSYLIGANAWRGPFEFLIVLGAWLAIGRRYTLKSLWLWFSAASLMALTLVMDEAWFLIASLTQIDQFTSYVIKPQDGVIIAASLVVLALSARLIRKGFDFMVAGHLVLLAIATTFMIFVHVVTIMGVGNVLENRDLNTLKIKATSEFFTDMCHEAGYGCYEGKWRADNAYPITLNEDLSRFVYSQFIDTPKDKMVGKQYGDNSSRIGGFEGINWFSEDKDFNIHAWNTGWTDVSVIDQPEKYAVYFKNGDTVRVMIDYHSAVYVRVSIIAVMRPFLTVFAIVWILGGLCMLMMHSTFPRFRKRAGASQNQS